MIMVLLSLVVYITLFFMFLDKATKKDNYEDDDDDDEELEVQQKTITVIPGLDKDINVRPEPEIVAIVPQIVGSAYQGEKEMW